LEVEVLVELPLEHHQPLLRSTVKTLLHLVLLLLVVDEVEVTQEQLLNQELTVALVVEPVGIKALEQLLRKLKLLLPEQQLQIFHLVQVAQLAPVKAM
jgi:hypothetical protein